MEQVKKRPRTTANKEQETFHKRKRGIQKKAHELSTFTKTDVYQVIFRDDQYYTFTSAVRDNWPPSNADIANHLPPADRKVPSDFTTIPFPSRRRRTEKKPSLSAEPLKTDGTRQDSEGHSTGVVHSQSDTPPQAQVALPKQISAEISPNSSASGMYNPGNSLKKRKFDSLDNEERLGDDRALKERIYRQKAGGDRASKRRYFPVPRLPVLPRLFEAWRL